MYICIYRHRIIVYCLLSVILQKMLLFCWYAMQVIFLLINNIQLPIKAVLCTILKSVTFKPTTSVTAFVGRNTSNSDFLSLNASVSVFPLQPESEISLFLNMCAQGVGCAERILAHRAYAYVSC